MEGRALHLRPASEWIRVDDSLGLVMLRIRIMMTMIRMMMTMMTMMMRMTMMKMMKYPDASMTVPSSAITRIGGEFVLEKKIIHPRHCSDQSDLCDHAMTGYHCEHYNQQDQ